MTPSSPNDLNTDFSQSQNLAGQHPDKVMELKKMFRKEAKKYQVLPLDASEAARAVTCELGGPKTRKRK